MVVLDIENEIFTMHKTALVKPIIIPIYSFHRASVVLLINKKIFAKYFHFLDIFFSDSMAELPKYTRINDYCINPLEDK